MGDLTRNLSRHELACRHCGKLIVHPHLPVTFQQVRDFCSLTLGRDVPLIVTSGYRCPVHNRAEGGVEDSTHVKGMAIDMYSPVVKVKQLHDLILRGHHEMRFSHLGGLGYYPKRGFVHIDVLKDGNRLRRWRG